MCVNVTESIYTFPTRIVSKTATLDKVRLNADVSCCLMEANGLSNLLLNLEMLFDISPD